MRIADWVSYIPQSAIEESCAANRPAYPPELSAGQNTMNAWHFCLDAQGTNSEVTGRHLSLIINAEVYGVLAPVPAAAVHHQRRSN